MEEIWNDLPGYKGLYKISDIGNVKSFHKNKWTLLKPQKTTNGYHYITICKNKIQIKTRIHQLVAMAFLGYKRGSYETVVNHINHIKTDNRLSNLEIVTQRENTNQKHLKSYSKYVGVSWSSSRNKYMASLRINNKTVFLLRTPNEEKAHKALCNCC